MTMKTVGVIGAGASGLAACKELKEAGFEVTVFDRNNRPGGRWALEGDTGVWQEMHLNVNRRHFEFSDFPWEAATYRNHDKAYGGLFAHPSEANAYVESYTKHFDLYPNIKFMTEVKSAKEEDGGWTVVTKLREGGAETTHKFDYLVVCSGIHAQPHHPLAETIQSFKGNVLHSQYFRSVHDYKGSRILVVGSGFSGSEIASSLATDGSCKTIVNAVRHAPYHLSLFPPNSDIPGDDLALARFPVWLGQIMPEAMMAAGMKAAIVKDWPEQLTMENDGISPDADIRVATVSVSKNYMNKVRSGDIRVKPGITSVDGSSVTFADGTTEEFDFIICATGYKLDCAFFSSDLMEKISFASPLTGKSELTLYKDTLVPGMKDLAFCGMMNLFGPCLPTVEMQARYIAAVFSGKLPFPSDATMQKGVASCMSKRASHALNQTDNSIELCEDLGRDLGVRPTVLQAMWAPRKYLFSPAYSVVYRTNANVEGKEKAARLRAVFDEYVARPQKATW